MFNTYFLSFTFSSVTVATVLTALEVDGLEWLDLLYFFSYIKLYISFAKYVPQVSCMTLTGFERFCTAAATRERRVSQRHSLTR